MSVKEITFYKGFGTKTQGPTKTKVKDAAKSFFDQHPSEKSVDIYEGVEYNGTFVVNANSEPLELDREDC